MALPQDISPLNSTIIDSLAKSSEMAWIPNADDPERAAMKILWTGSETGTWAVLLRWKKGYSAPPHKHLSAAHTFILSGKLQVRTGILNAGDYLYEANGMVHGATTALEDTEYLFICNGAVLFFNDDKFTSYLSWEELRRIEAAAQKKDTRSAA
ncbi:MAG TPA: cupin domain-containing protein [Candidatus Binataceae bacterium]|nr:cupin domain-containing protein [Candidatus Binataceae bacterium]